MVEICSTTEYLPTVYDAENYAPLVSDACHLRKFWIKEVYIANNKVDIARLVIVIRYNIFDFFVL